MTFGPEDFGDSSYTDGYGASLLGCSSDENGYEPGTEEHENWRAGWNDGEREKRTHPPTRSDG